MNGAFILIIIVLGEVIRELGCTNLNRFLSSGKSYTIFILVILFLGFMIFLSSSAFAQVSVPNVNLSITGSQKPQDISNALQLLILLTVLTLAPSIMIMMTSFTRIVIVLSLVRQAIGTPTLPPNQIIVGLALILTFFVMAPYFDKINTSAIKPYMEGSINQTEALKRGAQPLRDFMYKQTDKKDLELFIKMSKSKPPKVVADIPTYVMLPAFIISELKKAFQIGFIVFLPFLVIDIVVSSILVSMGMLFLPPVTISLPFKIILFVMVDGWHLICQALVAGFAT